GRKLRRSEYVESRRHADFRVEALSDRPALACAGWFPTHRKQRQELQRDRLRSRFGRSAILLRRVGLSPSRLPELLHAATPEAVSGRRVNILRYGHDQPRAEVRFRISRCRRPLADRVAWRPGFLL